MALISETNIWFAKNQLEICREYSKEISVTTLFDCFYFQRYTSVSTIYNMSSRVVSDIQTRAEGESLYIRYNTDANVVNDLKNDSSYEFIGEVILKINVV
jgi:hypothetical protein